MAGRFHPERQLTISRMALGWKRLKGPLLQALLQDGPADKAGLKIGDVILDVNGERIEEMPELPACRGGCAPRQHGQNQGLAGWPDAHDQREDWAFAR